MFYYWCNDEGYILKQGQRFKSFLMYWNLQILLKGNETSWGLGVGYRMGQVFVGPKAVSGPNNFFKMGLNFESIPLPKIGEDRVYWVFSGANQLSSL